MKNRYFLALILLCLSLWQASPSFAASYNISAITDVQGDCLTSINLFMDLSVAGVDADTTAPDRDWISFLIYDGNGNYFRGVNIWIATGFGGNFSNYSYGVFPLNSTQIPTARPFTIYVYDNNAPASSLAEALSGTLLDSITFNPAQFGACTSIPYRAAHEAGVVPAFSDGRINNWDTASPVVVYGHDGATGRGLVIYSAAGELLFVVSADELAAAGDCPAENTLIASAGDVALYRLSSCEYQINAPSLDGTKTYVMIFSGLYENTGYTSHEE